MLVDEQLVVVLGVVVPVDLLVLGEVLVLDGVRDVLLECLVAADVLLVDLGALDVLLAVVDLAPAAAPLLLHTAQLCSPPLSSRSECR